MAHPRAGMTGCRCPGRQAHRSVRGWGQGRCQSVKQEPKCPLSKGHASISSSLANPVHNPAGQVLPACGGHVPQGRARAPPSGERGPTGPSPLSARSGLTVTHVSAAGSAVSKPRSSSDDRGGHRGLCQSSLCGSVTETPSPQSGAWAPPPPPLPSHGGSKGYSGQGIQP